MKNDDGLPVETISWYDAIEDACKELGENINLLVCTIDKDKLFIPFEKGKFSNVEKFVAWTPRYAFTNVVANGVEVLTYVARSPMTQFVTKH